MASATQELMHCGAKPGVDHDVIGMSKKVPLAMYTAAASNKDQATIRAFPVGSVSGLSSMIMDMRCVANVHSVVTEQHRPCILLNAKCACACGWDAKCCYRPLPLPDQTMHEIPEMGRSVNNSWEAHSGALHQFWDSHMQSRGRLALERTGLV